MWEAEEQHIAMVWAEYNAFTADTVNNISYIFLLKLTGQRSFIS